MICDPSPVRSEMETIVAGSFNPHGVSLLLIEPAHSDVGGELSKGKIPITTPGDVAGLESK
jgi:hypothetical protein